MLNLPPNIIAARQGVFEQLNRAIERVHRAESGIELQPGEALNLCSVIARAQRLVDNLPDEELTSEQREQCARAQTLLGSHHEWFSLALEELDLERLLNSISSCFTDPNLPPLEYMRWLVEADHSVSALQLLETKREVAQGSHQLIKQLNLRISPALEITSQLSSRAANFIQAQRPQGAWGDVWADVVSAPARLAEEKLIIDEFFAAPDPRILLRDPDQQPTIWSVLEEYRKKLDLTSLLDQFLNPDPVIAFAANDEALPNAVELQKISQYRIDGREVEVSIIHYPKEAKLQFAAEEGLSLKVIAGEQEYLNESGELLLNIDSQLRAVSIVLFVNDQLVDTFSLDDE